jgi:hypothetical protein
VGEAPPIPEAELLLIPPVDPKSCPLPLPEAWLDKLPLAPAPLATLPLVPAPPVVLPLVPAPLAT